MVGQYMSIRNCILFTNQIALQKIVPLNPMRFAQTCHTQARRTAMALHRIPDVCSLGKYSRLQIYRAANIRTYVCISNTHNTHARITTQYTQCLKPTRQLTINVWTNKGKSERHEVRTYLRNERHDPKHLPRCCCVRTCQSVPIE